MSVYSLIYSINVTEDVPRPGRATYLHMPKPFDILKLRLDRSADKMVISLIKPLDMLGGFHVITSKRQAKGSLEYHEVKRELAGYVYTMNFGSDIVDAEFNLIIFLDATFVSRLSHEMSWVERLQEILSETICEKNAICDASDDSDKDALSKPDLVHSQCKSLSELFALEATSYGMTTCWETILSLSGLHNCGVKFEVPLMKLSLGITFADQNVEESFFLATQITLSRPLAEECHLWLRVYSGTNFEHLISGHNIIMPLGCLRFKIRAIPKALLKQNAALKIRADFIATKDVLCKLASETIDRIDLVQDKLHKSEQLELIVGDQSLYVSKKLLINESGYFKAKLNFEPNAQSASFEASNVSFVILKYLIDYLIHGKMNLMYLFDNASTTYQASKYFDVPKLTDYLTKCIPWLSVSSMLKLALSADSHSDTATALKVIGRFSMRPDLVNTKHLCSWAPMIRNHPALLIEFLTIINPKLKSNPKYRLAKAHQDLLVYHLCRAYLSDRMADIARSRIELSKKMSAKALSVYVIAKHHKDGVLCQMALQIILSNMAAIERSALWKKYADDENNEIVSEIRNYVKSSSN